MNITRQSANWHARLFSDILSVTKDTLKTPLIAEREILMSNTLHSTAPTTKGDGPLSWWTRIAYGCGDTACNIVMAGMVNSLLTLFYTDYAGVSIATVGLVFLISAVRQGQLCANGITGMAQGHDVQTNTMIYAALPEFYAILALVGTFLV